MKEITDNISYVLKKLGGTKDILPHVVVVKTQTDEIGRRVFDYTSLREYDSVTSFQSVEFKDGVAEYKGKWKGFMVQCTGGSIRINYSSRIDEVLSGGLMLNAGDTFGITDVILMKVRIEQGEGGSAIISFIGE